MKFRTLLRSGSLLIVAQVIAAASQLGFSVYAGRVLSESDFGAMGSLQRLFMFGTLPLSALMLQTSYHVAKLKIQGKQDELRAYLFGKAKQFFLVGSLGLGILVALTPLFRDWQHIPGTLPVFFVWLSLFLALQARLTYGTLQGLQWFTWLAVFLGVPPTLRLLFAMTVPQSLVFIMGASTLSAVVEVVGSYIVVFWRGGARLAEASGEDTISVETKSIAFLPTLLGLGCLAVLTSADMFIIRNFFPGEDSGYYAVVNQIATGLILFPLSIAYVLFPNVSEQSMRNNDARGILAKALIATSGIVTLFCLPCIFMPKLLIQVLFGLDKYAPAVPLLQIVIFSVIPLALVNILVHHLLAIREKLFLPVLIAVAVVHVALLYSFGDTPGMMLITMGGGGLVVTAALMVLAFRPIRPEPFS